MMKRAILLFLCVILPVQPALAQEAAPKLTNPWLARISNNFTKLPDWLTLDWLKKVPKSTWQRINRLFGGFDMLTIFGIKSMRKGCDTIKRYLRYKHVRKTIDRLLGLIKENRYYQNSYRPGFWRDAKKLIQPLEPYGVRYYYHTPDLTYESVGDAGIRLDRSLASLKQTRVVKKYIETGEDPCKKLARISSSKEGLISARDITILTLLCVAVALGILLSPDIYFYYKKQLFKGQISQKPVEQVDPDGMQAIEILRMQIVDFLSGREQEARSRLGYYSAVYHEDDLYLRLGYYSAVYLIEKGLLSPDDVLFLAESDAKTAQYLQQNLTSLVTTIADITPIGIIASTPYIKDENRMGYIKKLRDAGKQPTEQDKKLVNLLTWKLKKAHRSSMKGMREFRKLGAIGKSEEEITRTQMAFPPGVLSIIQQRIYPEYMQYPFEK